MHESGAGLHGGVREALAAGRDGQLKGILGTVARAARGSRAPRSRHRGRAGSRLQDLVVSTWSNAEAAIAHLKQSGAGRATFQPLDAFPEAESRCLRPRQRTLPGFWVWPRIWFPRRRRSPRSLPHCSGGRWWPTIWSPRERRCSTSPGLERRHRHRGDRPRRWCGDRRIRRERERRRSAGSAS